MGDAPSYSLGFVPVEVGSDSSLVGPLGEVMLELGAMRLRMNFKRTRGERLSEILEYLAAIDGLDSVDPVLWQREIRGDRSLPGR
jgi:hypothetical protein